MADKPKQPTIKLPLSAATRVDVNRLFREVDSLNNFIKASTIREPGTQPQLPKTSKLLDELLSTNKLNALVTDDRERLSAFLGELKEQAPLLHISFQADPPPQFMQKLMQWLRQEIHPHVLVQIGLQPGIGAGCVVRTQNKYFDFSLRNYFDSKRELLLTKLHNAPEVEPAPPKQTADEVTS
ncbi:MAG: hypothetical protein U5K77_03090 [Candidatus Saccharibacteria bacterium]|nr:hypothetical protein [Candidatus Saccharibacteria bacterium]